MGKYSPLVVVITRVRPEIKGREKKKRKNDSALDPWEK